MMKYNAIKLPSIDRWVVMIDDGPACIPALNSEEGAKHIARALNRDKLFPEMADLLREYSSYLNGPLDRAKDILTKINDAGKDI